ncbi:MAG: hypothetical protein OEY56_12540 [Cyclobacteriaceae bacterium]|nr:hypothetical protein [Cyclobacteriaceae bacterium]
MKKNTLLLLFWLILLVSAMAQSKPTIAVVSIDTKDLEIDNLTMAGIVRLELEKINKFEVLDRYDVSDIITKNNIDPEQCFGKNAVTQAGQLLKSDKMLTGSAEKIGDKIIIILRLIDVPGARVETTSVMEYLNAQDEIQTMVLISINELLGIPNDPHLVDLLINYNLPITTMKTTMSLNGPRMGATYTSGETGERMQAAKDEGGFNMFPVSSMFGYQFEKQYLSSGDFQALVEMVVTVNGLESGTFIPSVTLLNGFRFNKSGLEIGLGPIFRAVKVARGYYQDGKWFLEYEQPELPVGATILERLDNRGNVKPSLGLIVAFGKTFHSGYLNIPINVYASPRKDGTVMGITFGFNTTQRPKL